ncbi:MAG TPA: hypothetical protein VFC41_05645 [Anaerovoracaceae bacterium]|nr:hypothetical protein [Anaerovoracaceae bacterium]
MATINIKEYSDMDSAECIRNGYMLLKQHSKYYVRLAGFPLMVLLKFESIDLAQLWIDSQGKRQLSEKIKEISDIRKSQRRFGSC